MTIKCCINLHTTYKVLDYKCSYDIDIASWTHIASDSNKWASVAKQKNNTFLLRTWFSWETSEGSHLKEARAGWENNCKGLCMWTVNNNSFMLIWGHYEPRLLDPIF